MDYDLQTHCPNCFALSHTPVCGVCHFDRETYLTRHAALHHLPLFTLLESDYLVGRVLGESHVAIVYAGLRCKDRLPCVIKEFYPHELAQRGLNAQTVNPKRYPEQLLSWQQCFVTEAQLLRSCYEYPSVETGIVRYNQLIKQHNTAYLVMERLTGHSLTHLLAELHTLTPDTIYLWLVPLLKTLQKLHTKGIYHRNISPNSVFLLAADQPILLDFGLGRAEISENGLKAVAFAVDSFVAPEQLTHSFCDQRTDFYALGGLIYFCLHGIAPPSAQALQQGASLTRLKQPTPTAAVLQKVVEQCLQLELTARPQDAGQLLRLLTTPSLDDSATEMILPVQPAYFAEPAATLVPDKPALDQPLPRPSLLKSFFYNVIGLVLALIILAGLGYVGILAYQSFDNDEVERHKEDNTLFSQAKTLEDYQAYLKNCISCESKIRAQEQVKQLQLEQQAALAREKQQAQESALFSNATTLVQLKVYVETCVICADKATAQNKINEFTEILRITDETELTTQEVAHQAVLKSPSQLADFYQQNCPKNLAFLQRMADQSYPAAQLLLAGCYHAGAGINRDDKEASLWYRKAAERGSVYAQYQLATLLNTSDNMVRNSQQAAKWYRQAAADGNVDAQYQLAKLYENGDGVSQDYAEAAKWYRKAAEQNHPQAQYQLGVMYLYGSGVEQNYQASLKWQRKAAEQGDVKAQFGLGTMYENGYGVEPNYQEAYDWYKRAANQGSEEAQSHIQGLSAGMMH